MAPGRTDIFPENLEKSHSRLESMLYNEGVVQTVSKIDDHYIKLHLKNERNGKESEVELPCDDAGTLYLDALEFLL